MQKFDKNDQQLDFSENQFDIINVEDKTSSIYSLMICKTTFKKKVTLILFFTNCYNPKSTKVHKWFSIKFMLSHHFQRNI